MTLKFDIKIEDDRRTMDATRAYAPASGRTLRGAYAGSDPAEVLALLADFGVVPTPASPTGAIVVGPAPTHPPIEAFVSVRELDALPFGSRVCDQDYDVWEKVPGGWSIDSATEGDDPYYQDVRALDLDARYGPVKLVRIGHIGPGESPA